MIAGLVVGHYLDNISLQPAAVVVYLAYCQLSKDSPKTNLLTISNYNICTHKNAHFCAFECWPV